MIAKRPDAITLPKLLYFQWDHRPQLRYAKYFMQHARDHVRCLEQHFEVVVVNEDCDYDVLCDRHAPDMCLFEVGYQSLLSHRIEIRNSATHPRIPKAALLNADSWAWTRAGALSDIERLGIGVAFSICTTVHDYMPEGLDDLFVWPNFVDPTVFRDYGHEKTVTAMLTGSQIELYPWRRRVFPVLERSFPTRVTPTHHCMDASAARAVMGEDYARQLNASHFAPACGTMAGEVVRKHFEIPGAGSCLIAERTPMVEAAGFRHMETCVFADSDDVVEVVEGLLADPDLLHRISRAGHDLVHARHTLAHRSQIHDWFRLTQGGAGGRIEQRGPFDALSPVDPGQPPAGMIRSGGLDRAMLTRAHDLLRQADVPRARSAFAACTTLVGEAPEGRLGLALCDLADGNPGAAAETLARLIEQTTVVYGAADPDPVEWAVYLSAIARLGRESRGPALWCRGIPR